MGQINVLDISVANLIAAGEVVERPSAAIKELVENSIDAGAKNITVEIQKGGVALFRVTDDGCGMSGEDAVLSVKRHATSKIKTAKDLNQIMTLGFRGEALAAISAVTRFRMLTKRKEDTAGTALSMEYGSMPKINEVGCPNGTTIICEGLFATTPARLKFLKSDVTETREVQSAVEKEAVSHPDIAFKLITDGNVKFASNGNGKLSDTIYSVYGREFANSLTPVYSSSSGITVEGFVSAPTYSRGNRGMQIFFVNGRPVRSKIMSAALDQAGETYIPVGRYPSCVLNISIHSAYVDVNIHPSKLEVKVVPVHNVYVMHMTFDDNTENKAIKQKHERICAIDLGVNNFVAMTNNFDKPSMLFKGGRIKSVNHWYNKRVSELVSKQTIGTTNKYVPTTRYKAITFKRNNIMSDFMHKVARRVIDYCIEENVDTLVVGDNKGWKQRIKLSKVENQKFVQIPFDKFKNNLEYLCKREGIELVFTEESYTSKASHLDNDVIPNLYETTIEFSGVRGPTRYLGKTNKNGYRGLYMRKTDNTVINSDLNGSANIGRKAFPMFTCSLNTFKNILVIKDPN